MPINYEQVDKAVRDGHDLNSILDTMKSQGLDTSSIPQGNYDEMGKAIRDGHSMADIASHMSSTKDSTIVQPTIDQQGNEVYNLDQPASTGMPFSFAPPSDTMQLDTGLEGTVPPEDTRTTMTPDQMDTSKLAEEQTAATPGMMQAGIASTFQGAIQTGHDILNTVGIQTDSTESQQVIKLLNNEIKAYEDKYGEGFNVADMGRLLPTLATLPIAYTSKMIGFAVEGAMAYAESRGSGTSKGRALINGILAGGLTAGVMKGIDMLSVPQAKFAYDEALERFQYTPEEADKIFNNWSKVMEVGDNPWAAKTKALLDHADKNRFGLGEKLKAKAASEDVDVAIGIEREILDRRDSIKQLSANKYDTFESAAHDIQKVNDQIKDDYQFVKESIAPQEIKESFDMSSIPDINSEMFKNLPDYIRSDMVELKSLATNPNPTVGDLLDASKAVNSLLSRPNMAGTSKGFKVGQIKGQINKALQKHLSPEEFKKWMTVNSDYRRMKQVQNSKLGQAMEQIIGVNAKADSKTIDEFLNQLPRLTESHETFKAVEHLIGTNKASKLESKIVDSVLDSGNPYAWDKLHAVVGKNGFVTESGKALQNLSKQLSESFKNDAAYKAALQDIEVHQGAKTTMESVLDALMIKAIAKFAVRRLPWGQAGRLARQEARLSNILSNPNNVKEIGRAIDELGIGVRQQIIRDVVKQIEYKPEVVKSADEVNVKPLYATEGGTVGATPSATKLYEDQNKILQDFLDRTLTPNKVKNTDVIESVHTIANDNKLTKIATDISQKMKVDDAAANARMLRRIVTKEADTLIRNIEKAHGVKLPNSEAEKIVKLKFQKLAEECGE